MHVHKLLKQLNPNQQLTST